MKAILLALLFITGVHFCSAQETKLVHLANLFINTLTQEQQLKTVYPFLSDERYNFHFVPKEREGISINELNEKQRQAGLRLLASCLSREGFDKATEIMQLEKILKVVERRAEHDRYRDTGKYFLIIFGKPGEGGAWGWRFEGHHISFSFSARDNLMVSATPGFLGSNPAIVREGMHKGKQVLKKETELGFDLLRSFSATQLEKVIASADAPNDIRSFTQRKPVIDNNAGISYREMNAVQKEKLRTLVNLYIHRYTKLFADQMLKDIQRAGLDELKFVWMGGKENQEGNPHYYKIQGPTLLIEYDNTQNNANHIHSVVRDLKNDFGGDVLLEHYKTAHAGGR